MDSSDVVEVARERTIQVLCHHYAHDRLSVDELDTRLSRAQRASSRDELEALLVGLPPLSSLPARATDVALTEDTANVGVTRRREERISAIMSEQKRTGSWVVPEHVRVVAVMSDVKLDLTEARLGAHTLIECSAWMSSVRILVPPGVRLETAGGTFIGTFSERWSFDDTLPTDAPTVRIVGLAAMADVDVKVDAPRPLGRKRLTR